ncbi:paxillin-like isoform X1 [Zootermopsis nevadensis]|uniref:paxillin-like isoform X1 n=1 Tax=Zootermopsis nevadensis TaxID=136037 RepID=UPI000B8EB35E|nr:paxillin-like isoform X1 [Zootermopsis nevadensis]
MESQEECFVIDDLNRAGDAVSGLYGETCDSFDSELHLVSVDNMLSLDALLADLQNTISPTNGLTSPGSGSGSGYGSLNGTRGRDPVGYGGDYGTTRSVTSERYETRHSQGPVSPTYQNQRVIQETVTTTKTAYPQSPPGKMASLNNNLSELDTLLQDLSNAHYAGYVERRDVSLVNGSPTAAMVTKSSHESRVRPSVDSLLDELNTAVPNGEVGDGRHVTRTIAVHETQAEMGYPGASNSGASSATKELDDLMASLSDFKINASTHQHQTVTDSPYAKPNKATKSSPSPQPTANLQTQQLTTSVVLPTGGSGKQNQLDSMLGNLQADMSRQGVNTTQKGCCNACDKPIVGQVITALGKTWHPEHFTCTHCNQELGTRNFFERDGHPYCEPDYHNLFSPRCAYCNGPILDKCVTALEKTWHTEHFFCAQCGKQFGEEGFHERDGKPYCRDDYFDMFAPKCGGCNRPIMENYISALNSQWHADCFVCRDCRQPFHGGSFFDHEGLPYCETHYHAKRGSLCAGCHKPITGRCITAMFRKFHPEHFVCAFCLKQLNKGTFKEQNDKPYCHACFDKLFG